MIELILASTSTYRAELLKRTNFEFKCIKPDVDEDKFKVNISSPIELAKILACEKAKDVFKKNPNSICIGSDQVACLDKEIFSKPKTKEKALEQLLKLQNKTHQLITAVYLKGPSTDIAFENITNLKMRPFNPEQLKKYIELDQPLDCAGSYKLECHGISLFEKIETTDSSAIIGLPLIELTNHLNKIGFKLFK